MSRNFEFDEISRNFNIYSKHPISAIRCKVLEIYEALMQGSMSHSWIGEGFESCLSIGGLFDQLGSTNLDADQSAIRTKIIEKRCIGPLYIIQMVSEDGI